MTLKENFENIIYNYIGSEWDRRDVSNSLENDAEDFAIGFAEWIRKETYYEHLTKEFIYKRNVYKCEKELLQIYKQEQQL